MTVYARLRRSLSGRTSELQLDVSELRWIRHGAPPAHVYGEHEMDLCELARVVHEIDRRLPKRIVADRINEIAIRAPVHDPDRWQNVAPMLAKLLHVQGNAEWDFSFSRRPKHAKSSLYPLTERLDAETRDVPEADRVVLFSGGLDSTSGLASIASAHASTIVVSYYTGNLAKQRRLANALAFDRHVQLRGNWSRPAATRTGGSFNYRSFLFLALAAAEASMNGVDRIYQFENGPLALSVAPSPIYRITRHAHPRVQQLATEIFSTVLDRPGLSIQNPFLAKTKKEVVKELRTWAKSITHFRGLVADTETCWYLKSRQIVGAVAKQPNEPCGVCIPCLVRRAALGKADVPATVDLTNPNDRYFTDEVVRLNVDSYLDMAERMLRPNYDVVGFFEELPRVTASYLAKGDGLSLDDAYAMFIRFSRDLVKTFPRCE
jgi:7-cyano-7-deazaguanine synthase in queuosine biosynthesis